MRISAHYELTVRDGKGKVVRRLRRRSHSYVLAFIDYLSGFNRYTTVTIPDTTNVGRILAIVSQVGHLRLDAPATISAYGPVVGTGTAAITIADYALAAQIPHGTAAGQMSYQVTTLTAPTTVANKRSYTVQRVFVNNSGASITINECGLYCSGQDTGGVTRYFLIVRDLVSPGLAVPNGASATLTYTISITV